MEDKSRIVRDHRLHSVGSVAAPKRKAHEVVVLARDPACQSVEPVADPFEVTGRFVVREVRVGVTDFLCLFRREIAALLQGLGEEISGHCSCRSAHVQSFKNLEVLCAVISSPASPVPWIVFQALCGAAP